MKLLIEKDLDTLVYFGSGLIEREKIPKFEKAYFIDGDENICETLSINYLSDDSVTIMNRVIGNEKQKGKFITYSFGDYNGIGSPTLLNEIYPNLKIVSEQYKEIERCTDILSEIDIDWHKSNILIIDLPGISDTVINELFSSFSLYNFKYVQCYLPFAPLFEGEADFNLLIEKISINNFELISQEDNLSEYKSVLFERKLLSEKYLSTNEKNENLARKIDLAEKELAKLKQRNSILMTERDSARKERDDIKSSLVSKKEELNAFGLQLQLSENKHLSTNKVLEDTRKENANLCAKSKKLEYQLTQSRKKLAGLESKIDLIKEVQSRRDIK